VGIGSKCAGTGEIGLNHENRAKFCNTRCKQWLVRVVVCGEGEASWVLSRLENREGLGALHPQIFTPRTATEENVQLDTSGGKDHGQIWYCDIATCIALHNEIASVQTSKESVKSVYKLSK